MVSINLIVEDSEIATEFYRLIFGAVVWQKNFNCPKGFKSSRFKIGETDFALLDENTEYGSKSPTLLGGTPAYLQLVVEDVLEWKQTESGYSPTLVSGISKFVERILQHGGVVVLPSTVDKMIQNMSDGLLYCNVRDPFGFVWQISSLDKITNEQVSNRVV